MIMCARRTHIIRAIASRTADGVMTYRTGSALGAGVVVVVGRAVGAFPASADVGVQRAVTRTAQLHLATCENNVEGQDKIDYYIRNGMLYINK